MYLRKIRRLNYDALAELAQRADTRGKTRVAEFCDNELEHRQREEDNRDWDEADRNAYESERIEMWRNEY